MIVKLKHQLHKNSDVVFLRKEIFFYIYILKTYIFLDLGSMANIDQHEIIFPTVYSMMGFGKKKFLIKFGLLP